MRHKFPTWLLPILSALFYASAISYTVFWMADAVRPGFVARYFSVHIFGLLALAFGAGLAVFGYEAKERKWPRVAFALCIALAGAVIFWQVGRNTGDLRIFLSVLAMLIGVSIVSLHRD